MSAQRPVVHPFDVLSLSKGDWLSPVLCEEVLGIERSDRRYALRLLGLRDSIEEQWKEYRDEGVTIVCEKDGLRICSDDQAIEVNRERRLGHVRGLQRAQVRQMNVDRSKVSTPELRALHEREIVVGAAFLSGGKKEQQAALAAHVRQTPKMLNDKKQEK